MSGPNPDYPAFERLAAQANLVPMCRRLMSDTLTPVLAYRRLVSPDERMASSFLLESVEAASRVGRYSYLGSQPIVQIIARGRQVTYIHQQQPKLSREIESDNPLGEMDKLTGAWKIAHLEGLPDFTGGWVGFASYDTVRYLEGEKLPDPPPDDRHLPDLHMGLYRQVVAFDHVQKTIVAMTHVLIDEHETIRAAYESGLAELDSLVQSIETPRTPRTPRSPRSCPTTSQSPYAELPVGQLDLDSHPPPLPPSNMGDGGYQKAVAIAKQYIAAGDIFQVVPSQRFELSTTCDPFDLYRSLRVVNPSPYMFYLQIQGGMLIGASPEILCQVHDRVVTSRPLAGTRPRGTDQKQDLELEQQLLNDPKELAEHAMLVDLGRNDLGRVGTPGSIQLPQIMAIERYSHVMHISSTVTAQLAEAYTCWDALRYTLPVGTVSGAPKVRAMQIIDELEPTRRGPYAGAVGYADFAGNMDMAIALRTMVVTPDAAEHGRWTVYIQAGAGIVADSDPDSEHREILNKAAAMAKAVDLAERAFSADDSDRLPT